MDSPQQQIYNQVEGGPHQQNIDGSPDDNQQHYYDNEGGIDGGDGYHNDSNGMQYDEDGNSVTKKLVGSRIARKQAEDDVKLLANRIALLKMEEQKVRN